MKKSIVKISLSLVVVSALLVACKKNQCEECHYDKNGSEIELGELCGDDLKDKEANGVNVDSTNYEVHCHEH